MKIICGWCKKLMGIREPIDDQTNTDGVCYDCLKKFYDSIGEEI